MYIDGFAPTFINNTIANNSIYGPYTSLGGGIFVDFGNCQGKNNIVSGNTAASDANCHGNVNFTYSLSVPQLTGTGNITGNPLFVNTSAGNFNLQAASPCIDAGDPTSPLDPDSTIADMGCYYFDQNVTFPDVNITLTPTIPQIIIPAIGGAFYFNATLDNNELTAQTFDVWIMIQLPNGAWYGPALGPLTMTLPPNFALVRLRAQTVPGSAPAGNYWYQGRIGDYPDAIWDSSGFAFTKSATGNSAPWVGDWSNAGQAFEESERALITHNSSLITSCAPNPFNPTTVLSFDLPMASLVKLEVFDINGRLVGAHGCAPYPAGRNRITFDGSALPSGLYLARFAAGDYSQVQKLILLK